MKKQLILGVVLLVVIVLLITVDLIFLRDCKHEQCTLATCTEASICSKCGEIVSNALGHTDLQWVVDKEPSCTENGSELQVCSVCEETVLTRSIVKLGHTRGEWIVDKEASCTEKGSKRLICSVCEETITTQPLTELGHKSGEWTVYVDATCTEDGIRHKYCTACDEILETETINNLGGHSDEVFEISNNGTIGSSITYRCSICGIKTVGVVKPIEAYAEKGLCYMEMISHRIHREYSVISFGGCGKHLYKFELIYISYNGFDNRPEFLSDFSENNTCSYDIYAFGYQAILKVTVKDEAGNIQIFEFADFS